MELTQEYFDQQLKNLVTKSDLKQFPTVADLDQRLASQTAELKAYADEQTAHLASVVNETIAEPMEGHFQELKDFVRVRDEVQALKLEMQRIKEALHLA